MKINENYKKLKASYLFSTIAKKVNEFSTQNPDKKIIRLGIGDVTKPLTPTIVKAFKDAAVILGTTSKSIEGRYYRNKETIDNMISHIVYSKKPWYYKLYKTICNFFIKK